MLIKFIFGSIFSNLIGYLVFYITLARSDNTIYSLGFAYLVHFILSQIMNVFFVFNKHAEIIKPIFVNIFLYMFLYIFNIVSISFGLYFYDFDKYTFQFIFMIFVMLVNYILQKYLYLMPCTISSFIKKL